MLKTRYKTKAICDLMKAKGLTLTEAFEDIDLHKPLDKKVLKNINDEEILNLQLKYFNNIDIIAEKTALGIYKSLLLTGSGGVGKTYGITQVFKKLGIKYEDKLSGDLSPTQLYVKLYENRYAGDVIVFDDADRVMYDKTSLGFLKRALDSGAKHRMIGYAGKLLKTNSGEIVPPNFEYKGSIIFISNVDIYAKSKKSNELAAHLQAIMSRSRYIDLYEINSEKDYLIRIEYLKEAICNNRNLDSIGKQIIDDYYQKNYKVIRELGVRNIDLMCDTLKTWNGNVKGFSDEVDVSFTSLRKG